MVKHQLVSLKYCPHQLYIGPIDYQRGDIQKSEGTIASSDPLKILSQKFTIYIWEKMYRKYEGPDTMKIFVRDLESQLDLSIYDLIDSCLLN